MAQCNSAALPARLGQLICRRGDRSRENCLGYIPDLASKFKFPQLLVMYPKQVTNA